MDQAPLGFCCAASQSNPRPMAASISCRTDTPISPGAVCDEVGADARCEQVGHGEEHRREDAPFESSPGADGVEEDVGGHVAAQECAGVDAEGPELADHDGVSSHMHDGSSEAVRV